MVELQVPFICIGGGAILVWFLLFAVHSFAQGSLKMSANTHVTQ